LQIKLIKGTHTSQKLYNTLFLIKEANVYLHLKLSFMLIGKVLFYTFRIYEKLLQCRDKQKNSTISNEIEISDISKLLSVVFLRLFSYLFSVAHAQLVKSSLGIPP